LGSATGPPRNRTTPKSRFGWRFSGGSVSSRASTSSYYHEQPNATFALSETEFIAQLRPEEEESGINEFLLEEWRMAQRRPTPSDPDTLLASQPDSGTHSIIDMCRGVSVEPAMFTVSPLTPAELVDLFGTATPSTEQVTAWVDHTGGHGERKGWVGLYLISYAADGSPENLHFAGFSGD
jgi:hypothetical protein